MKLSVSSTNTYLACQRKFWHAKIDLTASDTDYVRPNYFQFGAAYARIQEIVSEGWFLLSPELVINECIKEGLDTTNAAKMLAMLKTYQRNIDDRITTSSERTVYSEMILKHPFISGRIDKIIRRGNSIYIGEDKTAASINFALAETLKTDPQICGYAACREQIEEKIGCAISGVIYRVVTKPKQRRKKSELWLDYSERCECDFQEITVPLDSLDISGTIQRLELLHGEIVAKKDREEFIQNKRNCSANYQNCEYFSQCHGKTITEIGLKSENVSHSN